MLECRESLCLNTCPKTDTCPGASSELAKRLVQVSRRFRLAGVVRNQQCSDNLLEPRGDRPHPVRIVAPTDWGLKDSRHRMRASPKGPACHNRACLQQPNT